MEDSVGRQLVPRLFPASAVSRLFLARAQTQNALDVPATDCVTADHYVLQTALLAGAGNKGGRAIGSTDATGSQTVDPGWSRQRDMCARKILKLHSALGINWTTVRYDDPFHRGFEYVLFSDQDLYGPINELWG